MKGNANVIEAWQEACAAEVQSQMQYRQDAAVLDNLGLPALAAYLLKWADEEAEHFKRAMARLVFLEGKPEFQAEANEYRGDPEAILRGQLVLEQGARDMYQNLADLAGAAGDAPSRDLAAKLESDEEEHINWLEGELALIRMMGIAAWAGAWKARGSA